MDVKSAFLNGKLEEEHVEQPPGFESSRGNVHKILFVRKYNGDILLVPIYVDDIIFGSSSERLYKKFSELMSEKYEMSMMGELNYFLGLQVKQATNGILIKQGKYVKDLLKKFGFNDFSPMKTPMETGDKLGEDKDGKSVDTTTYRGMKGCKIDR
uniref:uncharacterized mitochondrial protein AtMg00810-like n=1 Tax=Erigeron canadensis TaxID=72917 RepID=UPI001CB97A77|nr:uncharacterized mitochondrial protein AtMg00810-like [Erigeron canadensis]